MDYMSYAFCMDLEVYCFDVQFVNAGLDASVMKAVLLAG